MNATATPISASNEYLQQNQKYDRLISIGRLFSNPWITTIVSILGSVSIWFSAHIIFSVPYSSFEAALPVIIPLLVAYPISLVFQSFTQALEQTNRSLIQANVEIAEQKRKLEESNETKLKLFSIVSHDLRGPIGTICNYLEFIQEEEFSSIEEILEMFPAMINEAKTTLQLMDNLLKWSKSQMQAIDLAPTFMNVQELLRENAGLFKTQLEKKNITLHAAESVPIAIQADRNMLLLVLRNLTANALKFTPEGGTITIKAEAVGDSVTISVEDSGVGISKTDQAKLFRADIQHTTPGTNMERGTGLGLLLCKQFIEKHHGTIWVESVPNKGSCFCFTLPKNMIDPAWEK